MNIKKFTQKDRYGNSMSFEFDVPPMQEVPQGGGQHPGMPVGTDTVPAWLTPGEFVMNAEATRKFKPQLEAMNNHGRVQQKAQGGSIPSPAPVYKNQGGQVPGYQGNGMTGMAGGLMAMDPMMSMSMPTNNSAMDTMVQPQMMPQRQPMPNQMAPIAQGYAPLYRQGGGYIDPRAQQIDDETAMFLKQMEELRQQQNKPSIMQGFIPGNEQVPAGKMIGSKGVQPVIPMDVPPTVQLPTPMEVQQAVPGQETVMPIRTQGGQPISERGKIYGGRGQSPGARSTPPQPQGIPQVNAGSPTYIDKMTQVESGGKPDAKNPESSATGLHQFTDDTWISVVKKYEPELAKGLSDKELLDLRTKPEISTRMAGYLTKENQDALSKEGLPTDDGALYLMHFAGSPRARSILKADPSTPVSDILPEHVIKANESVLRGKTAGEVVAWAREKMATNVANLDNGVGKGVNIPGISSANAEVPPPQGLKEFPRGGLTSEQGIPQVDPNAMVDAQKRREHPLYGETSASSSSPVNPTTGWGAYEDVGDPNAVPEGGVPETQPEVMSDVPVELNKDMNNPEAELGFSLSEDTPKGGRGSEGNRWVNSPKVADALDQVVKQTESQLSEDELNQTISEIDALRTGETEIAKRTDKGRMALNDIQGFLKDWGIADLFDKKEIGRMAALYLGSRMLGHSHGGSLNWAAKQYLTRVDAKVAGHDKIVNELIKGGKYTSSSIKKYQKSKDLNDLVPTGGKYSPTGKTKDILVNGKKVRVREVKGEGENGGTYYQTANGEIINQLSTKVQDYKPEYERGTDEYKARMSRARGDSFKTFEEIHKMHAKEKMGEDWVTHVEFGPEAATNDFMEWSESIGLDPESNQARAIMGNAYRQAIENGKDGKIKPTELRPYLEAQFIRETTGTQELFMVNREEADLGEAIPEYVRGDKMEILRANANVVAAEKLPDVARQTAIRTIFEHGVRKWGKLTEEQRKFYEKSAENGETGFYKFMDENIQSFVLNK